MAEQKYTQAELDKAVADALTAQKSESDKALETALAEQKEAHDAELEAAKESTSKMLKLVPGSYSSKSGKYKFKQGCLNTRIPNDLKGVSVEGVDYAPNAIIDSKTALKSKVLMEHLIKIGAGIIEKVAE